MNVQGVSVSVQRSNNMNFGKFVVVGSPNSVNGAIVLNNLLSAFEKNYDVSEPPQRAVNNLVTNKFSDLTNENEIQNLTEKLENVKSVDVVANFDKSEDAVEVSLVGDYVLDPYMIPDMPVRTRDIHGEYMKNRKGFGNFKYVPVDSKGNKLKAKISLNSEDFENKDMHINKFVNRCKKYLYAKEPKENMNKIKKAFQQCVCDLKEKGITSLRDLPDMKRDYTV